MDPDPGGPTPKSYGSEGSGTATLFESFMFQPWSQIEKPTWMCAAVIDRVERWAWALLLVPGLLLQLPHANIPRLVARLLPGSQPSLRLIIEYTSLRKVGSHISSVADVFGPPGSGSFYHQSKLVENLDSYWFVTSFCFLINEKWFRCTLKK